MNRPLRTGPAARPDACLPLTWPRRQSPPVQRTADHAWVSKGEIKEFFDPALHEVLDGALATTVL